MLGPGELLFVPSGCPHRVENLEKSLAISANFVNGSNIEVAKRELRVNGLLDPRAEQLLSVLDSVEFIHTLYSDTTLKHVKNRVCCC